MSFLYNTDEQTLDEHLTVNKRYNAVQLGNGVISVGSQTADVLELNVQGDKFVERSYEIYFGNHVYTRTQVLLPSVPNVVIDDSDPYEVQLTITE